MKRKLEKESVECNEKDELIKHLISLKCDDPRHLPSFEDIANAFGLGGRSGICKAEVSFGKGMCVDVWILQWAVLQDFLAQNSCNPIIYRW